MQDQVDALKDRLEGMEHFIWGNARAGFVEIMNRRLSRIENMGYLILGLVMANGTPAAISFIKGMLK